MVKIGVQNRLGGIPLMAQSAELSFGWIIISITARSH